jgi:DNA polymerase III subunit epsilon
MKEKIATHSKDEFDEDWLLNYNNPSKAKTGEIIEKLYYIVKSGNQEDKAYLASKVLTDEKNGFLSQLTKDLEHITIKNESFRVYRDIPEKHSGMSPEENISEKTYNSVKQKVNELTQKLDYVRKFVDNEREKLKINTKGVHGKCKYLFVDTETTGLPNNWKAPITNSTNWPRLVQIAWIEFDEEGNEISSSSHIIRPIGYSIPIDATKVHKISNDIAVEEGKELKEVLEMFDNKVKSAEYLVAHNMEFDEKILLAEYYRIKLPMENVQKIKKICTMHSTTNFCAIPGKYGDYKWPNLSELYLKTFNSQFKESHNAETDIRATAKCFWELKNNGKINWALQIS